MNPNQNLEINAETEKQQIDYKQNSISNADTNDLHSLSMVLFKGNENNKAYGPPSSIQAASRQKTDLYIGLSNQGATCYMNSLLQTLFMIPEFRIKILQWHYDPNIHVSMKNCIPYQLQKLFAKLQLKQQKYADTKDLTKSFQWESQNSFEQQDSSEFQKILFDAIDQTIKEIDQKSIIQSLFEGMILNYVQCNECENKSQRSEKYIDLQLTVKNLWEKIYNDNIHKAFQNYLKPEILEGSNQYFCELCGKKTDAKKGCKIDKLPEFMTISLNRFSFDYNSMQRIKLTENFEFPFLLNMNQYINGYDGIKQKQQDIFIQEESIQVSKQKQTEKSQIKKKSSKPSSGIRSFLQEKRKNKQQNQADVVVLNENFYQQQENEFIQNNDTQNQNQSFESNKCQNVAMVSLLDLDEDDLQFDADEDDLQNEILMIDKNCSQIDSIQNIQEIASIQSQQLSKESHNDSKANIPKCQIIDEMKLFLESHNDSKANIPKCQIIDEIKPKVQIFPKADIRNQIQEMLQDGPLVYELFSVLIHSGSAYGGHYYSYIKSFENQNWYNFDDSSVSEINQHEILKKVIGGTTSAYMLFYKQVKENPIIKVSDDLIPKYLIDVLNQEKQIQDKIMQENEDKSNLITLRVYYQIDTKLIQAKYSDTLKQLQNQVIEQFKLKDKPENIRLRGYIAHTDTMSECFSNKNDHSLSMLGFKPFKNLAIEIKKSKYFYRFNQYKFMDNNFMAN